MSSSRVQQFIQLDNEENVAIWLEKKVYQAFFEKKLSFLFMMVIVRVVGFFSPSFHLLARVLRLLLLTKVLMIGKNLRLLHIFFILLCKAILFKVRIKCIKHELRKASSQLCFSYYGDYNLTYKRIMRLFFPCKCFFPHILCVWQAFVSR